MDPQTVFIIDGDVSTRESMTEMARSRGLHAQSFSSAERLLAQLDGSATGCIC